MLSLFAVCLAMAACSSNADKGGEKLEAAMKAGGKTEVWEAAAELYAQKAECSAENLVQLTAAYSYLAEKEIEGAQDPANMKEYIEKALECYKLAMEKDAEAAEAAISGLGEKDLKANLERLKDNLERAAEAEQALLDQINS